MSEIIQGFINRFNIISNSDSDKDFFMNLYYYFDFIIKTPLLHNIWEKSSKIYAQKHSAIWKRFDNGKITVEEAKSQTLKFERFNLYATGAGIYVRVYLPLKDYINTEENDRDQDPAVIILMKGKKYAESLKQNGIDLKWDKEAIKTYGKWFENRDLYQSELNRFHMMLLNKLNDIELENKDKKDTYKSDFSEEKSILYINNIEIEIPTNRNEYYICKALNNKDPKEKVDWSIVYEEMTGEDLFGDGFDVTKAKKKIYDTKNRLNERVLEETGIEEFVSINSNTLYKNF